jgi:hypothetical protein
LGTPQLGRERQRFISAALKPWSQRLRQNEGIYEENGGTSEGRWANFYTNLAWELFVYIKGNFSLL